MVSTTLGPEVKAICKWKPDSVWSRARAVTTTGQTQGNESFFLGQRKTETEQRWRLAARFGDGKLRQFLCKCLFFLKKI